MKKLLAAMLMTSVAAGCATVSGAVNKWAAGFNSWNVIHEVNLSEYGLIVGRIQIIDKRKDKSWQWNNATWSFNAQLAPAGNPFYAKWVSASGDGYFAWSVPAGRYQSKTASLGGTKENAMLDNFHVDVAVQPGQAVYIGDVTFTILRSGLMAAQMETIFEDRHEEMLELMRQRLGARTFTYDVQLASHAVKEFPPTSSFQPSASTPSQPAPAAGQLLRGLDQARVVSEVTNTYFAEAGVARSIKSTVLGWEADGVRNMFPASIGSIIWYARLTDAGLIRDSFYPPYRAEWFAPDGSLYAAQAFKMSKFPRALVRTTLVCDPTLGAHLLGRWKVRVTRKGEVVDERTFQLVGD